MLGLINWFNSYCISYLAQFYCKIRSVRSVPDLFQVTMGELNYSITVTLLPSILKCIVPVNSKFFNISDKFLDLEMRPPYS